MKEFLSLSFFSLAVILISGCQSRVEKPTSQATVAPSPAEVVATPAPVPTSSLPNLQSELAICQFDLAAVGVFPSVRQRICVVFEIKCADRIGGVFIASV